MRKAGIKILIIVYAVCMLLVETIIFIDSLTTQTWKAFIQSSVIIVLFSFLFLGGLLFAGKREIVSFVADQEDVELEVAIGKKIYIKKENVLYYNEYIHMCTCVIRIKGKKKHFYLYKKYFSSFPWE